MASILDGVLPKPLQTAQMRYIPMVNKRAEIFEVFSVFLLQTQGYSSNKQNMTSYRNSVPIISLFLTHTTILCTRVTLEILALTSPIIIFPVFLVHARNYSDLWPA